MMTTDCYYDAHDLDDDAAYTPTAAADYGLADMGDRELELAYLNAIAHYDYDLANAAASEITWRAEQGIPSRSVTLVCFDNKGRTREYRADPAHTERLGIGAVVLMAQQAQLLAQRAAEAAAWKTSREQAKAQAKAAQAALAAASKAKRAAK